MRMLIKRLKLVALLFILFSSIQVKAQVVYENPNHEITNFLSRQAQKGNITIDDYILPLSRKEISKLLLKLDSVSLTTVEKKELAFYHQEFSEFENRYPEEISILKKDQANRFRFLSVNKDGFILRGDPILSLETIQSLNQSVVKRSQGITFFGQFGKGFSFQASFRDIYETGDGLDSLKSFSPETGIIKIANLKPNAKVLNYGDVRAYVSYAWKNGAISLGKDQNLWGYGENGRLTLSNKAPAYPFIRFDHQPLKWLKFNYMHAWLQSGIIDSANIYRKGNDIYGTNRDLFVPKFFVTHSLHFLPLKGLTLSVGESMVYSDRLDVAYFIPILFFKAYDRYSSRYNINAGANSQFFFQASSRNHLKNTHIYTTLFIDEIRTSTIFDRARSRNQLGYNIGGSVTDFGLPYLTLGAEYTRINPFVYNNIIPAQTYQNQLSNLGDWMGSNSDRFITYIKYTPFPRLKTSLTYQKVRKGGDGTIEEQYFAEPQPAFLFNLQRTQSMLNFNASYEWFNGLYLNASLSNINNTFIEIPSQNRFTQFQFSIKYGL
jgi:hypothetical protein